MDTQKAFDNLKWEFLIKQLQQMEFGINIQMIIKGIYSNQSPKIKINGELTEKVNINQGSGQGCPLSSFLSILTLEIINNVYFYNV